MQRLSVCMDPWLEAAGGALAKVARCCGNDAQARSLPRSPLHSALAPQALARLLPAAVFRCCFFVYMPSEPICLGSEK